MCIDGEYGLIALYFSLDRLALNLESIIRADPLLAGLNR